VRSLVTDNSQQVKTCEICMIQGHTISYFSTLQGNPTNQVNVMGMVSYPQHKYDSNYKTYNHE